MFINNINPDIITLGNFALRFYGIVYALGFLLIAYILGKKKIKNLTKEKAFDFAFYMLLFGIIGARIFHVISDYHLYQNDFIGIFKIWNGGLGFQGGLIGAVVAGYFFGKKNKVNLFEVLDVAALYLPLIIGFGRIANYINSEHIGAVTNVPWCVVFQKIDELCRHPAQIYQALSQFLLFGALMLLSKRKLSRKTGILSWSFVLGYGIVRFITDFYRINHSMYFFGLSHTQLFSILMILIGGYFLYQSSKK